MADVTVESTCEEGYVTESRVGDFAVKIDATGEEGPTPNEMLVTDYASCWIPAFRVGAEQRGYEDVGKIVIEAEGDLDDDDDLEAIRFHVHVEVELADDASDIVERANDICHVHSALREGLHADVEVTDDAF
jgi:uncharacterized OsmC-like protein